MEELIRRASKVVGSQAKLAAALGVTQQTVSYWIKKSFVPIEYCSPMETACNRAVTRQQLCPDSWQVHWPELANGPAQHVPTQPD